MVLVSGNENDPPSGVTDSCVAIGGNGGALRQALTSQQFPSGQVRWGGQVLPSESRLQFPDPWQALKADP